MNKYKIYDPFLFCWNTAIGGFHHTLRIIIGSFKISSSTLIKHENLTYQKKKGVNNNKKK